MKKYYVNGACKKRHFNTLKEAKAYLRKATNIYNFGDVYIVRVDKVKGKLIRMVVG